MPQSDALTTIKNLLIGTDPTIIPVGATPFIASNQTLADSVTPRAVRAATTGKKKWLCGAIVTQQTASEDTTVIIEDDTGTPVVLAQLAAKSQVTAVTTFPVPIEVAAGKAINCRGVASTGDTRVTAWGYEEG